MLETDSDMMYSFGIENKLWTQETAKTDNANEKPRPFWWLPGVSVLLASVLNLEESRFDIWMKIEKVVFIQANRSFDRSGPIKLAKFRVFIYSKMEHKIKIRRNLYTNEKPRIWEFKRYIYFHNTMITSEIISQ